MNVRALESTIFIGKKENPKAFIKRKEVNEYCDYQFFQMYEIWENFNLGLGLPMGLPWDKLPLHIKDIIKTFEQEYKYMRGK
jgi:hypothetical protein